MNQGPTRTTRIADRILRWALGCIFIYASLGKIADPAGFASIIKDYRILAGQLVNPAAAILPWLELVLGVMLVAGRWRGASLLLVNVLLMTFWFMLIFNYFRGVDVGCGCFSTQPSDESHMAWYMLRDGSFVLMGLGASWMNWRLSRVEQNSPIPTPHS